MNFKTERVLNLIFFTIVFIWCLGIIWELIIQIFPHAAYIFPFLKYNYSIVCHTEQNKLYNFGIHKTLVCSRCTGIYFGALISAFLFLFGFRKNISTKVFLLSSAPMFLDVILYSLGLYSYSKNFALFTGLLLGSVGFIYIRISLIELFTNKKDLN